MDGNRFDNLSRALTRGLTRRGAIKVFAAALIGGGTTRLAGDAAAIPPGPSRRSLCRVPFAGCTRHQQCCSGTCTTGRQLPRNLRNRCACYDGLTGCNGFCIDLDTDNNHCGACGNACADGRRCCAGTCLDTSADEANCGACGIVCADGHQCCDGTCLDTSADEANCGDCGIVCASTEWCVSGVCECKRLCDGRECGDDSCGGTCGTCTDDNTCIDGACLCDGAVCADGTKCCDETCLDTSDDDANCGACGNVCGAAERCLDSTCVGICYLRPMGYLTKGNQFFEANSSTYSYTTPMPAWDPPLTNTSCTVDSDCSSCPTQVRTGGSIRTVVGCGCQYLLCLGGSAIAPFNAGNCAVYGSF